MRRVPPTASGIMTPLTSIGNTKASSVSHPCVMCNGCGKPPWPKLPNEKDENPPPDTCAPFSSCSELETLSQFDMTDAQRKHRWRKEGHASIWLAQLCRASGRFASCLGQRDQSPLLTRGDVSSNLSAQRGTIRGISGFLILRGDFGRVKMSRPI